jgi:hypothetical protein
MFAPEEFLGKDGDTVKGAEKSQSDLSLFQEDVIGFGIRHHMLVPDSSKCPTLSNQLSKLSPFPRNVIVIFLFRT